MSHRKKAHKKHSYNKLCLMATELAFDGKALFFIENKIAQIKLYVLFLSFDAHLLADL